MKDQQALKYQGILDELASIAMRVDDVKNEIQSADDVLHSKNQILESLTQIFGKLISTRKSVLNESHSPTRKVLMRFAKPKAVPAK